MPPVLKPSHSKSYKMPKDRNFRWRAAHFVGHVSCLLPKAQTDGKHRAIGLGLAGPCNRRYLRRRQPSSSQQVLADKLEALSVYLFNDFRIAAAQTVFAVRYSQHDVRN